MPKDVIITPASGLLDFQGNTGISSATIQLDDNGNLNIANPGGDLTLGDTSRDIFIGNGVDNVDIVFEQDGEIRGLTNKTISLGQTDSYIKIVGGLKDSTNNVGTASSVLLSTGSGISWTPISTAALQGVQGTQGLQGVQGTQGIQGVQGITGPIAGTNSQVIFNNNNVSAGATNFVYIATTQNVGIGTTNPIAQLHLSGFSTTNSNLKIGSLEFQNYSLNNSFFGDNVYWNGSAMVRRSTGSAGLFYFIGDEGQFRLSPVGLAGSETVNSPQLKINSNGGFGIGSSLSQTANNFTGANFYVNPQGIVLVGTVSSTGTANQALQVESGAYFNGSVGIGTTNPGNAFNFSGITSTTTKFDVRGKTLLYYDSNVGYAVTKGDMDTYAVLKLRGHATDSTNMQFAHMNLGTAMGIQVTNYENNANWDLLLNPFGGQIAIGTTIFTGTVNQPLQVTGGAYVSGNLGIGTANPTSKLYVVGDGYFTGVVTATSFGGSGTNLTGIVTSIVAGTNITVSGSTGLVTINSSGGGGATLDILEVMLFA